MSLISSLLTAGTGLRTSARNTELISRNISNANTEGYNRKDLILESMPGYMGGGVRVSAINRNADASLTRAFRFENANTFSHQQTYESLDPYISVLGQPGDEISFVASLGEFKNSLIRLRNNPSSAPVQRTVVMAAEKLAIRLNQTSVSLRNAQSDIEISLRANVDNTNKMLRDIAEINDQIPKLSGREAEVLELLDKRDVLVDKVSEMLNVRAVEYGNGQVALYTGGGTTLIDGRDVFELELTTPATDWTISAGGIDITPGPLNPRGIETGRIGSAMITRNETLDTFRLQLDEVARSLMEAFESADTTVTPGNPGLFTDAGAAYNVANLEDLAGRIRVNDAVKPEAGGELWRIRDGVAATTENGASYTDQVEAFLDIFDQMYTYSGATTLTTSARIEDFAADVVAYQAVFVKDAKTRWEVSDISLESITSARLNVSGVSIDDELQKLLLVEQVYSANAQVLNAAKTMMDTLLQST